MTELKESPRPKPSNGPGKAKEIAPEIEAATQKGMVTPFTFMRRFAEEMDRIFEDFGLEAGLHTPRILTRGRELIRRGTGLVEAEWSPTVDVLHRDGQFVVRADLPGLTKEEVKVEIVDDILTIRGERKQEKKEEHKGYSYSECTYGSFYRSIPLPKGAETSKANASFRNGVLEVAMPAVPEGEKKARRVEIGE